MEGYTTPIGPPEVHNEKEMCDLLDLEETREFCLFRELPFRLKNFSWREYIVYGYVFPILVLITIVTTTLLSVVLLKENMRSPTNVLLVVISLSQLVTGLLVIPGKIYFITLGNSMEWVPASWCYAFDLTTKTLPMICRTAHIWLTVVLALERYVWVHHPIKAKQWCIIPNMLWATLMVYILTILFNIKKFFDVEYTAVLAQSRQNASKIILTCMRVELQVKKAFLNSNSHYMVNISWFWWHLIYANLIPCAALLVLITLFIWALYNVQRQCETLLRQNQCEEWRRLMDSDCTTLVVIAIISLVLLVTLPLAFLLFIIKLEVFMPHSFLEPEHLQTAFFSIELCFLLSYPLNFFIYLGISRSFREKFKRLFIRGSSALDQESSQYLSLAVQDGDVRQSDVTEDTAI